MSQPIHMSGANLRVSDSFKYQGNRKVVTDTNSIFTTVSTWLTPNMTTGNARLLAAAYNAFDSAAKKLGLNAVELAERMQDGEIASLVSAIEQLMWQVVNGTSVEQGNAAIEARAILTRVRGDAA